MPVSQSHSWHFEKFDPASQWIFVTPGAHAEAIGLYVMELGHFYQDGCCITNRLPENSFGLSFSKDRKDLPQRLEIRYPDWERPLVVEPSAAPLITLQDNRPGYRAEQHGPCESYFIQFSGTMAQTYAEAILDGAPLRSFRVDWGSVCLDIYEKLARLYRQPSNEKRDVYASMLLTQLLSRLLLETDSAQPLYVQNPYVEQTLQWIDARYAEGIRLTEAAAALHIDPSYLSRLITRETGVSFSECVAHVRMNHAKELLRISERSVEEIAAHCGFCNASHFIRLFRSREGLTPHQYRRMYRQG